MTLQPDEALDIEANWHSVRVLSGRAWLNLNGINISLNCGKQAMIPKESDDAMIFAASRAVIQVFYQPVI
jgi:hypothetical protein